MARSGFPSMTALLGLLAVAGYQNRDRLSEMMRNTQGGGQGGGFGGQSGFGGQGGLGGGHQHSQSGGLGGMLGGAGGQMGGGLGGLLGGLMGGGAGGMGGLGGLLGGGLGELDQQMRRNGRGEAVDSWVGTGSNRQIEPHDLEAALGPEVLDDIQEQTGLPRQEILARLSRELPYAVDQYTPQGRIPDPHSF